MTRIYFEAMAQTQLYELSEEDLIDDLITLVDNAVEPGIDTGIIEDDDDCIQIVSSTQDDSSLQDEVSWYGKRSVVPITFFNNARNIKLLSKCQQMSVQVVDCDKCPWYYEKRTQKPGPKTRQLIKLIKDNNNADSYKIVESFTDTTNKNKDIPDRIDTANELSDDEVIFIPNSKKDSVGESDKSETEANFRKQTRISEMNFKKNTGLIGMKVSSMFEDTEKDTNENKNTMQGDQTKTIRETKETSFSNEKHSRLHSVVVVPNVENQREEKTKKKTNDTKFVKNQIQTKKKPVHSNSKIERQKTVKKIIYLDSLRGPEPVKKKPTDIRTKIKSQRHKLHASMMKTSDDGNTSPIFPCPSISKKKIKESQSTLNSHLVLGKSSGNNTSSEEARKRQRTNSSDQAVETIQTSLLEQLIATMSTPPSLPAVKEQIKVSVIVKPATHLPPSMPILEDEANTTSSQVPNQSKNLTKSVDSVSSKKSPTDERTVSKTTWDADLRTVTPKKKNENKPLTKSTENKKNSSSQKKESAEPTIKTSQCIVFSKTWNPTALNKPEPNKVVPMLNNQKKPATSVPDTTQINISTTSNYQKAAAVTTSEVPKNMPKVNDRRNIKTINPEETQKVSLTTIDYQKTTAIQNFETPKIMPKVNDQQNNLTSNLEISQNVTSTTANFQVANTINNSETQKSTPTVYDQTNNLPITLETIQKLIPKVQKQGTLKVRPLSELSKPLPPSYDPQRVSIPPQWAGYSSGKPVQNLSNMVAFIENPPSNKDQQTPKDQWEQMCKEHRRKIYEQQNRETQYQQNTNIEMTSLHATAHQKDWYAQWQRSNATLQNLLQLQSHNSHYQHSNNPCLEKSANQYAPPAQIYNKACDGVSPYHNYTQNVSGPNADCYVPPPPPPPSYIQQFKNFNNQVSQAPNVNVPPMINYDQVPMNPAQILQNIQKPSPNNDKQTRIPSLLDTYLTSPRDSMQPMFSYSQPPPPPPPPPLEPAKENTTISTAENPVPIMQLNLHSPQQNVYRQQQPKPAVSAKDGVRMNLINIPLTITENGNALASTPAKERPVTTRRLSFHVNETEQLKVFTNEEPNTTTKTKSTRVNHPYANAVQLTVQPKTSVSLRRRLSVDANCTLTTHLSRASSSTHQPKSDQEKKHKGYSAPILPIPTVERSLKLLSAAQAQEKKDDTDNSRTPKRQENQHAKPGSINAKSSVNYKRCPDKRKSIDEQNEDVKKKITLNEYLKRLNTEGKSNDLSNGAESPKQNEAKVDNRKISRKRSNSGNLSDLGYDSDSTVKL